MQKLDLPDKLVRMLDDLVDGLKSIYKEGLISVILYGSAASGEYAGGHSNLNITIILDDARLSNVVKASGLFRKRRFRIVRPVFFTEEYITASKDVFPLEFLDMKENHSVLYGKDALQGLEIDLKNLRFQCEQELKSKLINMKEAYLANQDPADLKRLLFRLSTSILHILRNLAKMKGRVPPYSRKDAVKYLAETFGNDMAVFGRILDAKRGGARLAGRDIKKLFVEFADSAEKIVAIVDKF